MTRTSAALRLAAALITVACAVPAAAMATDYCVADSACVTAGGVDKGTGGAGLTAALSAAADHDGADRVLVGPGTYTRSGSATGSAFSAAASGDTLTVQGAGPSTIITRDAIDSGTVLFIGSAATVRDLTVAIPGAHEMLGIYQQGTTDGVSVTAALGSATDVFDVNLLSGASFTHGSASAPGGTAFEMVGHTTLADSTGSGTFTVQAQGPGPITILRSRLTTGSGGYAVSAYYADLKVEDTVFDLGGQGGTGLLSVGNVGGDETAALHHDTFVHGAATGFAIALQAYGGGTSTATMSDSVVGGGVARSVQILADGSGSTGSLSTSSSSYPTTGDVLTGSGGAATPAAPTATDPLGLTPGFVDPAAGDWHLRPDSPLVDAGAPALAAGESTSDADGLPRVVGGRSDVGAFEVQPGPPAAAPVVVPPAVVPPVTAPAVAAPVFAAHPAAPVLSALALSPRAFRAGTGSRAGTKLTYKLSAAATVTFRVQRPEAGHRSGATCAARGKGKACTRYVTLAGQVTQKGAKGKDTLRFTGRLGKSMLKPGSYRLVATPAGGKAVAVTFAIAKPAAAAKRKG